MISFFERSSFKLRRETVIRFVLCCSHQACCLLYIWVKLTVAFTCTSLPLNLYASVYECGCGFGFEQKFWRIDGSGEKNHGSADLHTPIHPTPQVSSIKIVTVYRRSIFQVESHYTTSRPLSKVKPCQAGFASGWVTKYEYSVL